MIPCYPKTWFFEKQEKNYPKLKNSKTSRNMPKIAPFDALWPEVSNPPGSLVCTMFSKAKSAKKMFFCLFGDFRPLPNKNVQIWDYFFPLLFPKDSESLKILGIRIRQVGAKSSLNGTSKVNTRTDRHTDRQTDRRTNRLIESIGPEGRCFENHTN